MGHGPTSGIWFEIISPDAKRAKKFYADLFGWQVGSDPLMVPGDFGKFAIFTDPDGNHVGLWA
ncbi:MAG TPA: hypothetical protein VHZ03_48985 [Trebonia sp.]|jgi:predicted enzyme related to lactoylglutathione lyase|nr:hypothetical protein [Trebonia sp.]